MTQQDPRNSLLGWFFEKEEITHTLSNGHMINPSIDLTNACNLNCPYCFIEEKNSVRKVRKPHELTLEETLALIDELKSCGAKTINIVGAGEPTIDPHFEEVIDYISDNDMKVILFTNGIRFYNSPKLLEFLIRKSVSIVLKYNSKMGETQDLVAGRRGYSQKRNQVLEYLIDVGFCAFEPTRLGIDIIVFKGNLKEIPKIHNWCRANNIFPIAGEYIPTGRTESGEFQGFRAIEGFTASEQEEINQLLQPISNEERIELLLELKYIDDQFGIKRNDCIAYFGGGICTQTLGLYVDIEGNIWPCVARKKATGNGYSDGLLGNVRQGDRPSEIWCNHPYMQRIRQNFNGGCPYKASLNIVR